MQVHQKISLAGAVAAVLALAACGPASSGSGAQGVNPTVSGAVSADLAASRIVLRDSSDPAQERSTAPLSDGTYSIDVSGLAAPFVLRAEGEAGNWYAIVDKAGNADINELTTTAAVAACGEREGEDAGEALSGSRWREGATRIGSVIKALRTVLKPLFDLYGVTRIGGDDDEGDVSGMRAMLRDVSFGVRNGTVTVTNRTTGKVIFTGKLNDLASGTFSPENMPAGPGGAPACTYTYSDWSACQNGTQTRTVVSSTPAGCAGTPVLSMDCSVTPPTCTAFTYGGWTPALCPASGQQTRAVATSTPAGCTGGSPGPLTQTCTYVPPQPSTCTSFTYNAFGACVNGQQSRTVATSSPAGCTGGSPVLTQACTAPPATCTSFTYNAFGACVNGQQSRTVATSSPAGCTGGSPVLTQACTPPPVTCTSFTYSAFSACVNGSQTRTITSALPAGCTGGTPDVLTQACTPPPDGAALWTQTCSGCHGTAPGSNINIPKANRSVSAITSAGMTKGLNATQLQAVVDYLNTFP